MDASLGALRSARPLLMPIGRIAAPACADDLGPMPLGRIAAPGLPG
jgi:hypothetical protein